MQPRPPGPPGGFPTAGTGSNAPFGGQQQSNAGAPQPTGPGAAAPVSNGPPAFAGAPPGAGFAARPQMTSPLGATPTPVGGVPSAANGVGPGAPGSGGPPAPGKPLGPPSGGFAGGPPRPPAVAGTGGPPSLGLARPGGGGQAGAAPPAPFSKGPPAPGGPVRPGSGPLPFQTPPRPAGVSAPGAPPAPGGVPPMVRPPGMSGPGAAPQPARPGSSGPPGPQLHAPMGPPSGGLPRPPSSGAFPQAGAPPAFRTPPGAPPAFRAPPSGGLPGGPPRPSMVGMAPGMATTTTTSPGPLPPGSAQQQHVIGVGASPGKPGGVPPMMHAPPPAPGQQQQYHQQQQQQYQQQQYQQRPPPPGAAAPHFMGPPPPGGQPLTAPPPPGFAPPSFGLRPGAMPPGPPGPGAPGVPPQQAAAPVRGGPNSSSKIDPAKIPRPETDEPGAGELTLDRPRGPLDCSSRYIACSMNNVPTTRDMVKQAALPFAVVFQPLAVPDAGEEPLQVLDFGDSGPVRCAGCKAYMNPYMRWTDSGNKFVCNFCGASNPTPPDYFCHLGPDGRRRDAAERPELCRGSVEIQATKEYMARPPMAPTHFFLIDVSYASVSSGGLAAVCSSIARLLDELQGGPERVHVAVATYDSTVHFYGLSPSQSSPQMLVVADVSEVYSPLPASLVVPLAGSRQLIDSLLEALPRRFERSNASDTAGGAAIKAAVDVLKAGTGGQLHVFTSSLPKVGQMSLTLRDAQTGERDNQEALQPGSKEWKTLAEEAAEHQVCVDVFALQQSYMDIATLGLLVRLTGGQLYQYPKFNAQSDTAQLFNDLRWNLIRPQGLEAVARLRVSAGLTVDKYMGSFHQRYATDVEFPAISSDAAVIAQISHEERLEDEKEAYLQLALLFTSPQGERRIRVHTCAMPTTSALGSVFKGADMASVLAFVARRAAAGLPGSSLVSARDAVTKACVDTLYGYRKHCASSSSSGQLILPESLKLLPLYCLGLIKSGLLRTDTKADQRSFWVHALQAISAGRLGGFMHPRLLQLHTLLEQLPSLGGPDGSIARLPPGLPLTAAQFDGSGVYLVENGFEAVVIFGRMTSPEILEQLLGVSDIDHVNTRDPLKPATLPQLDNPLSKAVHQLLNLVRSNRSNYLRLSVVKRGDPGEADFFGALTEDRSGAGISYVDYLCLVHRQIQNKLN